MLAICVVEICWTAKVMLMQVPWDIQNTVVDMIDHVGDT